MPSVYRVRGLSVGQKTFARKSESHARRDPESLVKWLPEVMARPHLTDVVYHSQMLSRLGAALPTYGYVRDFFFTHPLKVAPLQIDAYLEQTGDPDPMYREILKVAEEQKRTESAIDEVLALPIGDLSSSTKNSPVAMAIACALRRSDPWFLENQGQVKDAILESADASYIALSSGAFIDDPTRLLQKAKESPSIILEMWRNQALRSYANEEFWEDALRSHSIHRAAIFALKGRHDLAIKLLYRAAECDPICAGICLALEPSHDKAKLWLSIAECKPEAFYWMGALCCAVWDRVSSHPYAGRAVSCLRSDPRWYYHWLRDVERWDASDGAKELWPSPWAMELIVDLQLPIKLVLELANSAPLDSKKQLENGLLLWAADYVTPDE